MTKIYFGCDEIPRHWDQYFSLCNALELDLDRFDNPPRIETLNGWRVDSPRGFAFVLHVDDEVEQGLIEAASSDGDGLPDRLRRGWDRTMEHANALAAKALLFRTPVSLSPGETSRSALDEFATTLAADFDRPIIWEAAGTWDTESTREWAAERGLTYAYDPFLAFRDDIELTHGDGAFVLSERAGLRREFDRYDIRGLIDAVSSYNRAFFLLRGRFKWKYAEHFGELLDY